MGYSRKRVGRDGRPRYTAYYWDAKDRERSAGTLPNKKDADRAWQRAEAKVAEGRLGDPGRGRWGELYRRLQLTSQIVAKLQAYVCERGLSNGDLVFAMPERGAVLKMLPNPARLGYTQPNAAGRTYRHGTLSAYTAGRCRCEHCRSAFAQYRRQRRAAGMDDPRTPRVRDTDGHIPRDWFRNQVWRPALAAAGVAGCVRTTCAMRTPHGCLLAVPISRR